jgi:hypothetical protein
MTKFHFPTINETFLRAAESCPQLTRELFLDQVRDHIAEGSLRATGFLFSIKTRPVHIGHYGTDLGVNERFTSSERTEIPPLAMADYRPIFTDGEDEASQVVRDPRIVYEPHDSYHGTVVAITKTDGWTDVRFPADDFEKLWANATTVDSRGPYDAGKKVDAAIKKCFPPSGVVPPKTELSNADLFRRVCAKHAELFKGCLAPHRDTVLKHAGR